MRLAFLVVAVVLVDIALLVLPPGREILDARFHYSGSEALAFAHALGPLGRHAYLVHECVDIGFIALYSTLLRVLGAR